LREIRREVTRKNAKERVKIFPARLTSIARAALILAVQRVEAYGGRFFLTGLRETMRSIFETSRLDQIFQIFSDLDAALAAG
jgi:anti-anti-sigma regulatory factor